MNFDSLKLPPLLIRDLYKDCLIDIEGQGFQSKKTQISDFALGKNLKHILIVINDSQTDMISEEELDFLTGVLKACKLSIQDVAVVNLTKLTDTKYLTLLEKFNPANVLLFGVTPQEIDLPVNFPAFKILNYRDIQFLYSPSLSVLKDDKLQKGKLWVCLQQLFL